MRKFLKLFPLIIFIITIQSLSAVHLGNMDRDDPNLNDETKTIKKRKIVVDFNAQKPTDLSELDFFSQDLLEAKLLARIEISGYQGYKKDNLEIMFRNLTNAPNVAAACVVVKNLGYGKFSVNDPLILFEAAYGASQNVINSINTKKIEYSDAGLL